MGPTKVQPRRFRSLLIAIDSGLVIVDAQRTARAQAVGKFMQGLSHGYLALYFDQAYIVGEGIRPDTLTTPGTVGIKLAPAPYRAVMDTALAELAEAALRAQVEAGAAAVQVFDSWVGTLSVADYREFVAPYSARILAAVDVPTIHFGTGTATLLRAMADAGGEVIGLDWRIPLDRGWAEVGSERGVQGNLDPAVLLGPWQRAEAAAQDILERVRGRRGHVFNLGHGVLPETDPAALRRLAELVQEATVEARV